MMLLSRLDVWLGKTLFHPPIILACQIMRQTQYAVHRALWFFAFCYAAYYAREIGWAWLVFVWLGVLGMFTSAAWFPDREVRSRGWVRFLLWQCLAFNLAELFLFSRLSPGLAQNIIILFAEYAATIKTIPPRRKRERRTSAKEARV